MFTSCPSLIFWRRISFSRFLVTDFLAVNYVAIPPIFSFSSTQCSSAICFSPLRPFLICFMIRCPPVRFLSQIPHFLAWYNPPCLFPYPQRFRFPVSPPPPPTLFSCGQYFYFIFLFENGRQAFSRACFQETTLPRSFRPVMSTCPPSVFFSKFSPAFLLAFKFLIGLPFLPTCLAMSILY